MRKNNIQYASDPNARQPNELTSLIPQEEIGVPVSPAVKTVSPVVKTVSFGIYGLFIAFLYVGNSRLVMELGKEGSGASSLIPSYQSVVLGAALGPSYAAGLKIGGLIGSKQYSKVGEFARASWLFNILVGGVASALMLITWPIFPHLFSKSVSDTAVSYFQGASIGNIAMLIYLVNAQLAMSQGHWLLPPLTGILLMITGVGTAYLLGFTANLGALGVGIGTSTGQILASLSLMLCFLHPSYSKYRLYQWKLSGFKEKVLGYCSDGWKLSFQRLTEWGNLFLISTIIGAASTEIMLRALAPAIQYIVILATAFQSLSQAAGILMKGNVEARAKALKEEKFDEAEAAAKKNVAVYRKNVGAGIVISLIIGGILYLARIPVVKLFLKNPEPESITLAVTSLWITMLPGLCFDSVRLVSIGAHRSWSNLLFPAITSLICMTVVGVPAGFGLTKIEHGSNSELSANAMMFYARDFTIAVTAGILAWGVERQMKKDIDTVKARQLSSLMPPVVPMRTQQTKDSVMSQQMNHDSSDTHLTK